MVGFLGQHLGSVARAFRDGAGVPYSAFRPGFTTLMDRLNRFRYDQLLVSGYLTAAGGLIERLGADRKSTRLNSSHSQISYAVFCLTKKKVTPATPVLPLRMRSTLSGPACTRINESGTRRRHVASPR